MQIPSELIDVSRDRLLSADDVQSELEALSSLRLAHSERVVDLLKEVDRAITRINDETYGICTKCGGEIDKQSLLKNITEDRCANCRADEESERGG
jgi:DnaK suppressor protein